MHFTTQFLTATRGNPLYNELYRPDLEAAVKFVLPMNAETGILITSSVIGLAKMPYDNIAFEIPCTPDRTFTKTIAHIQSWGDGQYQFVCFMFSPGYGWVVSPIVPTFNLDELIADIAANNERSNGEDVNISSHVIKYIKIDEARTRDRNTELKRDEIFKQYSGTMLMQCLAACIAMNACNVTEVEFTVSKLKQQIQLRNKKPPYFVLKTLDIFLGSKVLQAKPSMRAALARKFATTSQTTLALTSVRGHFKKRNGRLFWWRSHLRGSKENGVIIKDYKIELK